MKIISSLAPLIGGNRKSSYDIKNWNLPIIEKPLARITETVSTLEINQAFIRQIDSVFSPLKPVFDDGRPNYRSKGKLDESHWKEGEKGNTLESQDNLADIENKKQNLTNDPIAKQADNDEHSIRKTDNKVAENEIDKKISTEENQSEKSTIFEKQNEKNENILSNQENFTTDENRAEYKKKSSLLETGDVANFASINSSQADNQENKNEKNLEEESGKITENLEF